MDLRRHAWRAAFAVVVCCSFARAAEAQHLTSSPHIGVEQVPYSDDVYEFLRHLSIRGLIEGYSEDQLPLSEFEVTEFLRHVRVSDLSNAEAALLAKYLRTYAHEPREAVTMFSSQDATPLFFDGIFTQQDKYLYRWFDDSTKSDLFIHGVGAIEMRRELSPRSASLALLNAGGRFSGTLSGHVGYFMQTTNGHVGGDSLLAAQDPSLNSNRNFAIFTHSFFDNTTAELAYTYDWFTAKIAREQIGIGGGYENDNILLSPQAPNYDFFSLAAHVGAVRYQSLVASLVADTLAASDVRLKYMALHDLSFMIGRDVEWGFTDIVIFGKRFELGYANPFSFLKVVEHAVDNQDEDNAMLGMHVRWRITPGVEVRGQMMIDDIIAEKIGTGHWANKFAWQFGGMWAGAFGMRDLDWSAEWMRVEPYTYTHWNTDDERYTTAGTLLGAQIGPNAMSYWTGLRWAPSAQWTFRAEAQYVERGENIYDSSGTLLYNAGGDYNLSMTKEGNETASQILNGRRVNILNLIGSVEFEPWRGLVVFARGTKKSVSYLTEPPQTPGIDLSGKQISLAPREKPATIIAIGAKAFF
jgi:hypothetical protein